MAEASVPLPCWVIKVCKKENCPRQMQLDAIEAILGSPHLHNQKQRILHRHLKLVFIHDFPVTNFYELAKTHQITVKTRDVVHILEKPLIPILARKDN